VPPFASRLEVTKETKEKKATLPKKKEDKGSDDHH